MNHNLGAIVEKNFLIVHTTQQSANIRITGTHRTARVPNGPSRLYYVVVNLSPQSLIAVAMSKFFLEFKPRVAATELAALQRVVGIVDHLNFIRPADVAGDATLIMKRQEASQVLVACYWLA